eukprot:6687148-Alexandrium_andersonii.AAC.1
MQTPQQGPNSTDVKGLCMSCRGGAGEREGEGGEQADVQDVMAALPASIVQEDRRAWQALGLNPGDSHGGASSSSGAWRPAV